MGHLIVLTGLDRLDHPFAERLTRVQFLWGGEFDQSIAEFIAEKRTLLQRIV